MPSVRIYQREIHGDELWIHDVLARRETEKALLCRIDDMGHWIPKSQITDDSEVWKIGQEGILVITMWLAEQKKIVRSTLAQPAALIAVGTVRKIVLEE